jgi:hypothetical protein
MDSREWIESELPSSMRRTYVEAEVRHVHHQECEQGVIE